MTPTKHDTLIRWFKMTDIDAVLDIERRSFAMPWDLDDFGRVFVAPTVKCNVIENAGRVVGFMVYDLQKHHTDILNIAIHPEDRRCKFGSRLAMEWGGQWRKSIQAAVRETNVTAQLFFKHIGFRCTGISERHFCNDEAAYLFEYRV